MLPVEVGLSYLRTGFRLEAPGPKCLIENNWSCSSFHCDQCDLFYVLFTSFCY